MPLDTMIGGEDDGLFTCRSETGARGHVSCCLVVEPEAVDVDDVRTGTSRQFLHELLFSTMEDVATYAARGCCTVGKKIVDVVIAPAKHLTDNCAGFQACCIYHACRGGRSSDLGYPLLERLLPDSGKPSQDGDRNGPP